MHYLASSDTSIGSEIVGQRSGPPAHGRGRICADPECETQLSIYNEGKFCSIHTVCECPSCKRLAARKSKLELVRPMIDLSLELDAADAADAADPSSTGW